MMENKEFQHDRYHSDKDHIMNNVRLIDYEFLETIGIGK